MEFVRPIFTVVFTVTDPRLFDTQNGAVTLELVITAYTVTTDTPHIYFYNYTYLLSPNHRNAVQQNKVWCVG